MTTSPVAVGGIGGSGTRLVAGILQQLGYYIGSDLNGAYDNVWFSLLFKRPQVLQGGAEFRHALSIFFKAMTLSGPLGQDESAWVSGLGEERRMEPTPWLAQRIATLQMRLQSREQPPIHWGWKEPNTHIVLDQLQAALPGLRYIHVVRNGLDMAYSKNRKQVALWGDHFLHDHGSATTPHRTLRYWCVMQRRVIGLAATMGGRFLSVNYDRLCADPAAGIGALVAFLGVNVSPAQLLDLSQLVKPGAIGRYKHYGLRDLDPADVSYVAHLGFDTTV